MGVVRKQSTLTTITSIAGGVLGLINKALLFPRLLAPEAYGLAEFLVTIGVLIAQFSVWGFPNVSLKFFPFFENRKKGHHGFLTFGLLVLGTGMLISCLLYFIFQEDIKSFYEERSPLIAEYYFYGILFGISYGIFQLFWGYLRSVYKIFAPKFIQEVILRLLISISIAAYALGWVDLPEFVQLYTLAHMGMAFMIIAYTAYIRQLYLRPVSKKVIQPQVKPMMQHGIYVLLGGFSTQLLLRIDVLMLGKVGLDEVAIYSFVANFAIFLLFPYRSLFNASAPKVAEFWKTGNLERMNYWYKRVAFLGYAAGLWLMGGIWINLPNLYAIIDNEIYEAGTYIFLILGLGRLFEVATGLNSAILVTSRAYRYDLYINIFLLGLALLSNYYFIFVLNLGALGAAWATMISLVLYNLIRVLLVARLTKGHPFTWPMLWVSLFAIAAFLVSEFIPRLSTPIVDILVRSSIFTVLYLGILTLSKISSDINEVVRIAEKKLKEKFGQNEADN